jgi:hypothetical protein
MYTKLSLSLALGCLLALAACSGDDDEDKSKTPDAGADAGGSAAGSGAKGTGTGKEGAECDSHADCGSSLSCLKADERIEDLKVCARPCRLNDDCDDGELCRTPTREPTEAFCWNTETEALKPCGAAFTAICDEAKNLGCLLVEDDDGTVSGGVCLEPCTLGQGDACSDGFACLDLINQEKAGLCAHTVERGKVCDEPKGEFCEPGNLCLSDGSEWRCYQDCSQSNECADDKACKKLQDDQGAYCE